MDINRLNPLVRSVNRLINTDVRCNLTLAVFLALWLYPSGNHIMCHANKGQDISGLMLSIIRKQC
jgi:hypothetical protein